MLKNTLIKTILSLLFLLITTNAFAFNEYADINKCQSFKGTLENKSIHVFLIKSNKGKKTILAHMSGYPYDRMESLNLKYAFKVTDQSKDKPEEKKNVSLEIELKIAGTRFDKFLINDNVYGMYGGLSYSFKDNNFQYNKMRGFSANKKELTDKFIVVDQFLDQQDKTKKYQVIVCTQSIPD